MCQKRGSNGPETTSYNVFLTQRHGDTEAFIVFLCLCVRLREAFLSQVARRRAQESGGAGEQGSRGAEEQGSGGAGGGGAANR